VMSVFTHLIAYSAGQDAARLRARKKAKPINNAESHPPLSWAAKIIICVVWVILNVGFWYLIHPLLPPPEAGRW
jgi:hypothetical protein